MNEFPVVARLGCPWCDQERLCLRRRAHDDGVEYVCRTCERPHTRKNGREEAFIFFPGDIDRMVDPNLESELNWWDSEPPEATAGAVCHEPR